jgi:hypothetical protein
VGEEFGGEEIETGLRPCPGNGRARVCLAQDETLSHEGYGRRGRISGA